MTTKEHRGYVIVDRPVHINGLDQVIDFVEAGLKDYLIVQVPAGRTTRLSLTRWFCRNAPNSKYLKVNGHWDRDTWVLAFDSLATRRKFTHLLCMKHAHLTLWRGNDPAAFIDEASRVLELAKIDGRVEGARHGR